MQRRGFTLIELLAVIIILAVLALIATPIILGIINDTKKGAFKDSVYGISQAAKNAFVEIMYAGGAPRNIAYIYTDGVETSNPVGYKLKYEGAKPQNGQVLLNTQGQVALALHDGKYCVTKGYNDAEVTMEEKTFEECLPPVPMIVDTSGANAPVLTSGMVPITYDGTNWIKASNIDDIYEQNWYDYKKKKWANMATLDSSKAIDFSGNNNIGTIHGTTQYPDSRYFNGTSDYIDANTLSNYSFGNSLTFAIRFKATTLNVAQYLLGNWQGNGGGIILTSDNKIQFELDVGGYKEAFSTTTIQANTYYTVVGTYDGSNMKIYVNGVQEGIYAIAGNVGSSEVPVAVCVNPDVGANYNPCQGTYVSNVAVYDRALTVGEVGTLFANDTTMPTNEMLLEYQLIPPDSIKEGAKISVANMNSMWVWIPRYVYKISSGWHNNTAGTMNIQFSQGTDDNWNSDGIGALDSRTTAEASNAPANGDKYTNHPAFTFGTTELPGIWVAKFEATAVENITNGYRADGSCLAGDDVTTKKIKIVPGAVSWRCISINNIFTNTRNMETNNIYGWETTGSGIDTHLIKNMEWGAITYLSKSKYGKENEEIWINPANNFTTGCAGNTVDSSSTSGCANAYNTTNGVKASTTGNIYGIYDMAGGSFDYVAGYVNDGSTYLSQGSTLISANAKYRDVYTVGSPETATNNYASTINIKGDAIYETSSSTEGTYSWFNDNAYMVKAEGPWFLRSGLFTYTSSSGPYYFSWASGGQYNHSGFRPVLLVGTGL